MAETFFSKYPTIVYNNLQVRDITKRVALDDKISRIPTLFYPYEISNEMRSDQLSAFYYEDSYYDWLIFMTNGIIDPYYGWYLHNDEFAAFIKDKYGSEENALRKIMLYRINWATFNFNQEITSGDYDNLPAVIKKYYIPNYGYKNSILSYIRREEDWTVATNLLYKVYISDTSDFTKDMLCKITLDGTFIASCEVVSIEDDFLIVKHCQGEFFTSDEFITDCLIGDYDGTFTFDITEKTLISRSIPASEYVYWEPVSAYDYENEKNESRKHLRLLDKNYALKAAEALRLKMKNI